MLEVLLPAVGVLLALGLALSAAMAWGARRAQALAARKAPATFAAPPRAEAGAPQTRLAFLGDVQRGIADVAGPLAEALPREGVDLLVSSGDLVSHGEAPYYGVALAAFARAGWNTPSRVVPGNHDLWPRRSKDDRIGGALFEARFGPRHWAECVGPVLVVGVDNGADWLIEDQLPWLEGVLAEHPTLPWILVCHRPLYSFDREVRESPADLLPLVEVLRKRPAALAISGHLHAFHDETIDGVRHIVNAHGGDVHGLGIRRADFQLLLVDVDADGVRTEMKGYARKRDPRAYADQLAVRFWSDRRKPWGAVLAWPGRMVQKLLGLDVPVVRYPVERRVPSREVLAARRAEEYTS